MTRYVFFISDGTGITAEALGNSLLAQFANIDLVKKTLSYIDSKEKAYAAVLKINTLYAETNQKPLIFDTIVDQEIRMILTNSQGFMIDIFSTFLHPLEHELGTKSSYTVGKSHSIIDNDKYTVRMDAVNFALENDDGARTRHYDMADVIIVGVSRSGKTPTCLYLAMQFGIQAANYPFTEDDLDLGSLPKSLKPYKQKLFGLTIDADRLTAIRHERRPNSQYSSFKQCDLEARGVMALFVRENIPFINSTHASIEEISTRLMAACNLDRRI